MYNCLGMFEVDGYLHLLEEEVVEEEGGGGGGGEEMVRSRVALTHMLDQQDMII